MTIDDSPPSKPVRKRRASNALRAVESGARSFTQTIESSSIFRLCAMIAALLGFLIVMGTAYQIAIDLEDRQDERLARKSDSIERAWTRLLQPAAGNTGKGDALGVLMAQGVRTNGADFSCAVIGNNNRTDIDRCPIFTGDIEGRPQADLRVVPTASPYTNFAGVDFQSFNIRNLVWYPDLTGSRIVYSRFVTSRVLGIYRKLLITSSSIIDTEFTTEFDLGDAMPIIRYSNVSGSVIPWLKDVDEQSLVTNWFWADWPPKINDATRAKLRICKPPQSGGSAIAKGKRRLDPQNLVDCEETTLAQAKTDYPDAYKAE